MDAISLGGSGIAISSCSACVAHLLTSILSKSFPRGPTERGTRTAGSRFWCGLKLQIVKAFPAGLPNNVPYNKDLPCTTPGEVVGTKLAAASMGGTS
jgi:hypothetical protein